MLYKAYMGGYDADKNVSSNAGNCSTILSNRGSIPSVASLVVNSATTVAGLVSSNDVTAPQIEELESEDMEVQHECIVDKSSTSKPASDNIQDHCENKAEAPPNGKLIALQLCNNSCKGTTQSSQDETDFGESSSQTEEQQSEMPAKTKKKRLARIRLKSKSFCPNLYIEWSLAKRKAEKVPDKRRKKARTLFNFAEVCFLPDVKRSGKKIQTEISANIPIQEPSAEVDTLRTSVSKSKFSLKSKIYLSDLTGAKQSTLQPETRKESVEESNPDNNGLLSKTTTGIVSPGEPFLLKSPSKFTLAKTVESNGSFKKQTSAEISQKRK